MSNKTLLGDRIPTPREWILLMTGKINSDHAAFADVDTWVYHDTGALFVNYKSGRDEEYEFDMSCVGGGMILL